MDLTLLRIDPRDRPRHDDLGPESACLLQRPARQIVARNARGKAEVVLDPGGCSRLAARRFAFDHDRSKPFGRTVDGSCQSGRSRAHDHRVVLRGRRHRRDIEELGDAAQRRPHDGLPVDNPNHRIVVLVRQRSLPLLQIGRNIGLKPAEANLVAIEEAPQIRARRIPAVAENDRPDR